MNDRSESEKKVLLLAERFVMHILVKLNTLLTPFSRVQKDNQAYMNVVQHISADTEPRRYQNLPHFFANYYN